MNKVTKVVVGTGAELDIPIGFQPDSVSILNVSTRESVVFNSYDSVNTFGIGIGVDGLRTKAATAADGVVLYEGDKDNSDGVTLGDAASVNVLDDELLVEASYSTESA